MIKKVVAIGIISLFLLITLEPSITAFDEGDDNGDSREEITISTYLYDPLGNCIKSTNAMGEETYYLYNGNDVINDIDSTGFVLREYIDGFDGKLAMVDYTNLGDQPEDSVEILYYLHDNLGSIVALTDTTGNIVEQYFYEPYGETFVTDPTGEFIGSGRESLYGNPYMWKGYFYDSESNRYFVHGRSYSPPLGRFLQRNPSGYADGMNQYEYLSSNPTQWVSSDVQVASNDVYSDIGAYHDYDINVNDYPGRSPMYNPNFTPGEMQDYIAVAGASNGLRMMLISGELIDIYEACSGKDIITGEEFGWWCRGGTALCVIIPFVPGSWVRKAFGFIKNGLSKVKNTGLSKIKQQISRTSDKIRHWWTDFRSPRPYNKLAEKQVKEAARIAGIDDVYKYVDEISAAGDGDWFEVTKHGKRIIALDYMTLNLKQKGKSLIITLHELSHAIKWRHTLDYRYRGDFGRAYQHYLATNGIRAHKDFDELVAWDLAINIFRRSDNIPSKFKNEIWNGWLRYDMDHHMRPIYRYHEAFLG